MTLENTPPSSVLRSPTNLIPKDGLRQQPSPQTLRLPGWRFWVPLTLQLGLIVAIPAQDAWTFVTGEAVTLQTRPVDPYDLLRGYSQTLSYDISQPQTLQSLPGGKETLEDTARATPLYVVLAAPQIVGTTPPSPWKPVRVSRSRPQDLAPGQIALKGEYSGWQILYGLETYYMPEAQRQQINDHIQQVQGQEQPAFVVAIKVDAQGNSVPVSLWVEDRNYRF